MSAAPNALNAESVRHAVDATVSPLSDIARAGAWQRIEQAIAVPPPRVLRTHARTAVFGLAAAAALAAVVVISLRATTPSPGVPAHATALAVDAGAHLTHRWDSDLLDIHGPADLRLEHLLGARVLHVSAGTLRVHHTGTPLVVSTPSSTTWVTGPVFAIRVHGQTTEIASGEQAAKELIERNIVTLAPPPLPVTPPPVIPPPVIPSPVIPPPDSSSPAPRSPTPETDTDTDTEAEADTDTDTDTDTEAESETVPDSGLSPAARYALAESAMSAGATARAEALLAEVITADPDSRLAAAATLDLARLAFSRNDLPRARRLSDELLASNPDPNLRAPAQRLRCRIQRAQGERCVDPVSGP